MKTLLIIRAWSSAGAASTPPVMPAWPGRRLIGVKIVTVMPDNAERSLATVIGACMMLEGRTGRPIALIDGPVPTRRRTAATSALAAGYQALERT